MAFRPRGKIRPSREKEEKDSSFFSLSLSLVFTGLEIVQKC
jgi:hypothetical protein